jgi:nucleotide-binding universal stress UspA family protein
MKILIAYDGSSSADSALEDLRRAGLPEETEALIVSVADSRLIEHEPGRRTEEAAVSWMSKVQAAEGLAEKAAAKVSSDFPQWKVSVEGLWGPPSKIILDAAARFHPDLIVAGSHGHSPVTRFVLGSCSLDLVHNAPCSVRIARAPVYDAPAAARIVVGADGSPEAEAVVRSVASRTWPAGSEAHVLSVIQTLTPAQTSLGANTYASEKAYSVIRQTDESTRFRLESVSAEAANALRRAGLSARSSVIDGDPRDAVMAAAYAMHADAIFVGARGRGRMERLLLGSVSSYIVSHAKCSVEVVRARHD